MPDKRLPHRRLYGAGMKANLERERTTALERKLREAVVEATNQIPGTKPEWVYKLRSGRRSISGKYSATIARLKAAGIPIVGIIGVQHDAMLAWARDDHQEAA